MNVAKAKLFFLIALMSLISACGTTGLAALNSTIKIENKPGILRNLAYGQQEWQKLDVYPNKSLNPAPVIIFLYGGGWDSGKKSQYLFAANAFVKLGYTVVVPDYIKYPAGQFPSFVNDGAKAFEWTKQNIEKYNGDPNNTYIVGHSAGAHTGALLATDARYLSNVGFKKTDIRGFAGLAGPYGFTPKTRKYVAVFGSESNYPKMKAKNFVDGSEPPMLLMHGLGDRVVGVQNKDQLLGVLDKKNVKTLDIEYPGVSHVGILLKLHPWFDSKHQVANDIDAFFKSLIK